MRTTVLAAALLGAALAASAPAQPRPYTPGPQNITLPADWQARFIRYAKVDKPDRKIIRNIYINPEAFAALAPGQPLPLRPYAA